MSVKVKKDGINGVAIVGSMLVSFVASILMVMLLTSLIISERIGEWQSDRLMLPIWLIVGFVGGYTGRKTGKEMRVWLQLCACGIYATILLVSGMLLFEGGIYRPWLPLLLMTIGCLLSCNLPAKGKRKRRRNTHTR